MHSEQHVESVAIDPAFSLHSQMAIWERLALQNILGRMRPDVSIEIGTYRGGSLQMISHFSNHAISVDIDPSVPKRLANRFSNVEYRCGRSDQLLPEIFRACEKERRNIEFILVDGDHSTEGVRADINALLKYQPRTRCLVLIHDSFNPACREGIRTANWSSSDAVHGVEIDFVPGIYHHEAYDTAEARTMWGGFACCVLEPIKRDHELTVSASQQALYDTVYRVSAHVQTSNNLQRIRRRVGRAFAAVMGG